MFHVEKMRADDFVFAVQLANTNGWDMAVEDFEFAIKLEPEGCFVLFHGSERVGIVTCVSFKGVGWFGNLVVTESFQGRGAGALLVKHAIKYLISAGAETIGLYSYPHLTGFYKQFGFEPEEDFLVFHGKVASPASEEIAQLQKAKKQDIPLILNFDRQWFGANRKKVLEPILQDRINLCYILFDDSGFTGYCAATVYEKTSGVGPLICRQNRSDAAVPLIQTVLSKLENHDVFICVPAEENSLLDALFKVGLQEKFRVTRMFLGPGTAKGCTYIPESLERG